MPGVSSLFAHQHQQLTARISPQILQWKMPRLSDRLHRAMVSASVAQQTSGFGASHQDHNAARSNSRSNNRIVIVGGGPAGCLCAALMAQRGYQVDVFEQRQAPCQSDYRSHRSYPMVLTSRSTQGFQDARIQLSSMPKPQQGFLTMNGALNVLWEDSFFCRQYIVDRVMLGRQLFEAAHQEYDGQISWHWGKALQQIDFDRRVATFSSDSGVTLSQGSASSGVGASESSTAMDVSYELLVGADGANSKVRQLMQVVADVGVNLRFQSNTDYKTYHGLSLSELSGEPIPGFSKHDPNEYIYTFNVKDMPTLVMWRQADGTASGMLTRARSYDAQVLQSKLSSAYPQLPKQWVDSIVAQTSEASGQPPSPFGKLMTTTKFDGPRCVLLGDSAHPMTSTLAQGCNLALESVRVFVQTLDSVSGDLDKAPTAFTAARLEDVHAMQTIEYMQILNSNAPNASASALERINAKATMLGSALLTSALHKLMPGSFPAPVYLLEGLRDARVPYKQVLENMRLHAAVAIALATLVVSAGVNQAVARLN